MEDTMEQHTKRRGLKFRGAEGDFDVYEYFKGGRAVFEASIDRTDPELKIHVGKVGATFAKVNGIGKDVADYGDLFETTGRAGKSNHEDRLSSDSVKSYIQPRAFGILANLFVYKPATVTDAEAMDDIDN